MISDHELAPLLRERPAGFSAILSEVKQASIQGENFDGVDFSGLDLHGIRFTECSFRAADFSKAKIGPLLTKCDFSGARFIGSAIWAHLHECCFAGAEMRGCKTYLPRADGCDFSAMKGVLMETIGTQPLLLSDRGEKGVYLTIGCTTMRPHKFYRRRCHANYTLSLPDEENAYPSASFVPTVTEMLERVCDINRDDPQQWRGAVAELDTINHEIFQLLPAQHPVRRLQARCLLDQMVPA